MTTDPTSHGPSAVAEIIANGWHSGRSWTGHAIEDACPCEQQPCGLVDLTAANPDCDHHPILKSKSMRQGHPASACPGRSEEQR